MGRDTARPLQDAPGETFQSTRPHGARPLIDDASASEALFQSTRPHGARQPEKWMLIEEKRFNPRARMGRDTTVRRGHRWKVVSIHAPAWGATY